MDTLWISEVLEERKPRISVIIPCLNVASCLPNQMRALSEQECSYSWELIISDNGSTDETIAVARGWKDSVPFLHCVREPLKGRHHACNAGAKAARGEFLIFVDADDEVLPGFLQAMGDSLQSHSVVGGRLVHKNTQSGGTPTFGKVQTDQLLDGFGFLPFAMGACVGVRKDAFEAVGGFAKDKDFCEDVDLSWRLQLKGYSIQFVPEAAILYNQRTNLRRMLLQHYRFGQARALLYRDYSAHGMRRRRFKVVLSDWWMIAKALPRLRSYDQRARWVRRLGRCAGYLRGSLRYRVLYV